MSGETDLDRLLAGMRPALDPETYVFATMRNPPDIPVLMRFEEAEGTTLILPRAAAEAAGLPHEFPCRRITLTVHSALEAVGFIARIAARLAAEGMGVNPVAGFHHDHLFVPADRADEAMAALARMADEAQAGRGP